MYHGTINSGVKRLLGGDDSVRVSSVHGEENNYSLMAVELKKYTR